MIQTISTFLLIIQAREINVYGSYGLVSVQLNTDELIITNGEKQFSISLEYNTELTQEQ